jgi:tRNA(Ile)-lysidine synthase
MPDARSAAARPRARAKVGVAVSGGPDSLALLHATQRAAAALGVEVVALHVHHGLQAAADGWLKALEARCRRWRLPLAWTRLESKPAAGDSVQAWARRERYAALATLATEQGVGLVLLAQHRRDQAETWLLQALRSGGPTGLAAMPETFERHGVAWARPWLDRGRDDIESYLRRHRLRAIDDPANHDTRYARSRLREMVWPALLEAFPHAETALAASAARAAEAAEVLRDVAQHDRARVQGAPETDGVAPLIVARLLELSPARQANLLRHWLAEVLAGPVPESLVARLVAELPVAGGGARWPAERRSTSGPERGFLWLRRRSLAWMPAGASGPGETRP